MYKILALILSLLSSPAFAQNTLCANKPQGDNSNACANTRYVADFLNVPHTWTQPQTWSYTDTQNVGAGNFYTPWFFSHTLATGATGYRNSVVVQLSSGISVAGSFLVPIETIAHITAGGSGNAFGFNGYAWVDSGALATSSAYGGEFNTDVRRNITDKVGLQLVDVSTSTGVGSGRDAGLWMTTQTGGAGYKNGIEFSAGGGALPVKSSGSLIVSGAGTVTKGIDWLSTTFTGNIIDVPRMSLDPNGQLSVTRASAGRSLILTGFTGSDQGGEIQQTNATGGSKFLRVAGTGSWQIINSAYGASIFDITDAGIISVATWQGNKIAVAYGGTNCAAASGTCLDNITGFSGTGYIQRTGAGTYTFSSLLTSAASNPTLSSCGGSPAIDSGSSSNSGKITFGSATTACTLTFASAFANNAFCTVTPGAQPAAVANIPYISAQSKTAFTISGGTASAVYYYNCGGN
jgi:hypothetical protein